MNSRKVRFIPVVLPLVLGAGAALGGCAAETAEADGPTPSEATLVARAAEPPDDVLVLGSTDPAELALTSSQAFFTSAPVVVLAVADDEEARATAAAAAVELAAPVLLVGGAISDGGLRTELGRLGTVAVVEVGEADAPPGQEEGAEDEAPRRATLGDVDGVDRVLLDVGALGVDGTVDPHDLEDVRAALPERGEPETLTEVLALTEPGSLDAAGGPQSAAIATARAAGAVPLEVPGGDPRSSAEVVDAVAAAKALAVVGIGESFGEAEDLAWRLRTAEAGALLPSGSQLVLADGVRYVAVGADAVTRSLVAVGEEARSAAVERAQGAAGAYAEVSPDEVVVPVLEVPATRASSSAGPDRDYSTEIPAEELAPLVDAAEAAGVHVVLRIEPGRATFDEQVAEYADLLARPTVGVALDVDARRPGEGSPAGTVDAAEVGAAIDVVAGVVREHALPQKLVVVQRADADAVRDGADLDLGGGEAQVVVQSTSRNGFGERVREWGALLDGVPEGVVGGWTTGSADPARDVEGVLALDPSPRYVAPAL